MFEVLAAEGINIEMISTSTIRISCVVAEDDVEPAVRALHTAFGLDARRDDVSRSPVSSRADGATGLVGTEMLRILDERAFPVSELRAYASPRSLGRKLPFAGGEVECEVLAPGCFDGLDFVIVDVDDPLAAEWAPLAAAAGAKVVDNSAAFRMDPDVPLVIAEVNPDDVRIDAEGHRVVPQLHDDDPRHRARAAAPRRAHRPPGRVDVPVGVGRGPGRHARARRAVDEALRPQRRSSARAGTLDAAGRRGRGVAQADRGQRDPARRLDEGRRDTRRRSGR